MSGSKKYSDSWDYANQRLEQSEKLVRRTTGLVSALAILVGKTTILVTIIISVCQLSAGPKRECTNEIVKVGALPLIKATNEVFWNRHPELKRRKIRRYEDGLADEWRKIRDSIKSCRSG